MKREFVWHVRHSMWGTNGQHSRLMGLSQEEFTQLILDVPRVPADEGRGWCVVLLVPVVALRGVAAFNA